MLHASGAAKSDGHLAFIDDDRHGATTFAELQHAIQGVRVTRHVEKLRSVGEGFTSLLRVFSGWFSVDNDGTHLFLLRGNPVHRRNRG